MVLDWCWCWCGEARFEGREGQGELWSGRDGSEACAEEAGCGDSCWVMARVACWPCKCRGDEGEPSKWLPSAAAVRPGEEVNERLGAEAPCTESEGWEVRRDPRDRSTPGGEDVEWGGGGAVCASVLPMPGWFWGKGGGTGGSAAE